MAYYHATTRDRVASIQRHGLGGLPGAPKAFKGCPDGVYLAEDAMLALGFLLERALAGEFTSITPAQTLEQFVVFVIDCSRVDEKKLRLDPNIERRGFWLYSGVVDVTAMPVVSAADVTDLAFSKQSNETTNPGV